MLKFIKNEPKPPIPADTYPAVCVWVVDLGTQYSEKFKKNSRQCTLAWEICDDDLRIPYAKEGEEPKPMRRVVSRDFNMSMGSESKPSALYTCVSGWMGFQSRDDAEQFKFSDLVGKSCLLGVSVTENGKYNNVTTVSRLVKGMQPFEPEIPTVVYDLDEPDDEAFNLLPNWIRDKIMASVERNGEKANSKELDVDGKGDDELP